MGLDSDNLFFELASTVLVYHGTLRRSGEVVTSSRIFQAIISLLIVMLPCRIDLRSTVLSRHLPVLVRYKRFYATGAAVYLKFVT